MVQHSRFKILGSLICASAILLTSHSAAASDAKLGIAVGTQYNTAHVYMTPATIDAFIASFTATFGGHTVSPIVTNVLPVPSKEVFQGVYTPSGNLSVFAFQTPVPYPFGQERGGYLVSDMDQAIQEARKAGAEVIVEPFNDAIGRDAVIQWPGGMKMQFYWHTKAPSFPALQMVPDTRVYVSTDRAEEFVRDFDKFAHGKVVSDDKSADAGEIGRPGETYRCIRIESGFGKMLVMVTDGHLPYPFGCEQTGYEVDDLNATLAKAKASGVQVISKPYNAGDRNSAIVEFPGGYIAEIYAAAVH